MRVANFFLQVNGNASAAYSGNGGAERNRTADLCSAIAALSQLSYGPVPASGGAERDRTADPLLAKQVLSQLSYSP